MEINFYLRAAKAEMIETYKDQRKLEHLGVPQFVASGSFIYRWGISSVVVSSQLFYRWNTGLVTVLATPPPTVGQI